MQITPNEISTIEEAGTIDGNPCKLVRTKGGFWIMVGRRRGKPSEEALAAGSHPAIVKYNMEKQYPDFHPNMMKSEGFIEPIVEKHSHFLSEDLRKNGHDIYSIQRGPSVEFQITKQNACIANINGILDSNHLLLENFVISKEFSKAMAGSTTEKAISCKVGLKLRK